ncbi:hypothetical protein [Streptomyces sp. A5-4]|uniref:hypothetical protein n=1 Tax=Streptomyces sp. A5-4 TaxID=3384771 RepID=UPI003DA9B9AD
MNRHRREPQGPGGSRGPHIRHERRGRCRRRRLTAEQRIERALALLEGQDTDLAARLRAVLQGDQP